MTLEYPPLWQPCSVTTPHRSHETWEWPLQVCPGITSEEKTDD